MLYVITGGSGSGKSAYAEALAAAQYEKLGRAGRLYYVATMRPYDEECLARIERHRLMRKDRGFSTIECYCRLEQVCDGALQKPGADAMPGKRDVFLLECMSNLLANEMYEPEGRLGSAPADAEPTSEADRLEQAVLRPVLRLAREAGCLVVVTNEVFSDGRHFDPETERYVKLLGEINRRLAAAADGVTEVVCGIPVVQKGDTKC